eukprot:1192765-Prorocentrum_minimum.AAC.2
MPKRRGWCAAVPLPPPRAHYRRPHPDVWSRWTNQMQQTRAYSHDGPIGRRKRGYILTLWKIYTLSPQSPLPTTIATTTTQKSKRQTIGACLCAGEVALTTGCQLDCSCDSRSSLSTLND